jgi:hypothetical protein
VVIIASNLSFTQGNYGMLININVKDKNGIAIPLDGASVDIDLVFPDKTKKRYPLTILDSTNGKVQLKITTEMTEQVSVHIGFIDVTNPLSQITLEDLFKYNVKPADGGY